MSPPMLNPRRHASSLGTALNTIALSLSIGALAVRLCVPAAAQSPGAASSQSFPPATTPPNAQQEVSPIRVNSELVLVNVVARDKKGNLIHDLKKEDFSLFEDNRQQKISTFDFEDVDELQTAGAADATVSGVAAQGSLLRSTEQGTLQARDRRLMVLFFDFSAMEPEEIDRAVDAANKFIQTKMQPADLIAVVSLTTNLQVNMDFTDDRAKLRAVAGERY